MTMNKGEQIEVLKDAAGVIAEEMQLAHPLKLPGIDNVSPDVVSLLRAQFERDVLAIATALTTVGADIPVAKFIELCRNPVEHIMEPRSK